MSQVINDYDVFQLFIWNDSQVFNEKSIVSLHTIFSVHNSQNGFLFLVQVANNWFSIILGSGCEHINVENLTHRWQKFQAVRSDIEFELIAFVSKLDISFFVCEYGMNKSLIKIKDEEFLFRVWNKERIYLEVKGVWLFSFSNIIQKGLSNYWLNNTSHDKGVLWTF